MDYIATSRMLAAVSGVIITIGLYAQAIKIWRTKSAKDFSIVLIASLVLDELAWLNYGLAIVEWPIIMLGGVNLPAILIATIGYIKFRGGEGR